jgi:hypothetical protein
MWKTSVIVVLLFGVGWKILIFCYALLKCYCWYEVLWLLVEFKVGKELVVEKCGVLNCIATRFGFHVIFVFPLRCNCFHFHFMVLKIFCVLFVFMLWNKMSWPISYGWNHTMGEAKNVVTLYCFPGVSMFELQSW